MRSKGENMAEDTIVASAAFVVIAGLLHKKKRKRRWWETRIYRNRSFSREGLLLNSMLEKEENGHFRNFARMSSSDFSFLLESIREKISRNAVTAEEKLAITLRYLATGDSCTSLQYLFNVSKQLISRIVPKVCRAIVDTLIQFVKVSITLFVPVYWQYAMFYLQCVKFLRGIGLPEIP